MTDHEEEIVLKLIGSIVVYAPLLEWKKIEEELLKSLRDAKAEERERAAKIADVMGYNYGPHEMSGHFDGAMGDVCRKVAAAIRGKEHD